jgi:hypothetical protein
VLKEWEEWMEARPGQSYSLTVTLGSTDTSQRMSSDQPREN